jgi:hypothetical protein
MPLSAIDIPALVLCYEAYSKSGIVDAGVEGVRQNILRTPGSGDVAGITEHVIQYGWTPEATESVFSLGALIGLVALVPAAKGRVRAYRIRRATRLLEKMAESAERNVGGRGGVPGTHKHSYVGRMLRKYQGRYGEIGEGLKTEISYREAQRVNYGQGGSIRIDVVEGNPGSPNAVYELKFDDAKLGPARVVRVTKETGLARKFIIEIKPRR